jgi:predicted GIY-YIG superfamily endonuclease
MRGGWLYIVTKRPNAVLYVGVTSNLARRVWEHRAGMVGRNGMKISELRFSGRAISNALATDRAG